MSQSRPRRITRDQSPVLKRRLESVGGTRWTAASSPGTLDAVNARHPRRSDGLIQPPLREAAL